MAEAKPRLWSDFDGTAVALARKMDPRNWTKYPLKGLPGFTDFLSGAIREGVDFAGIVSRRPDIAPRRWVTMRSIRVLGIAGHFSDAANVVLAGSEEAKGRFLVDESRNSVVGMVEDKPHRLGKILIGSLLEAAAASEEINHTIVLGVVDHSKTDEYTERLLTSVESISRELTVESQDGLYTLRGPSFVVEVTQVGPYSEAAGRQFAHRLHRSA